MKKYGGGASNFVKIPIDDLDIDEIDEADNKKITTNHIVQLDIVEEEVKIDSRGARILGSLSSSPSRPTTIKTQSA